MVGWGRHGRKSTHVVVFSGMFGAVRLRLSSPPSHTTPMVVRYKSLAATIRFVWTDSQTYQMKKTPMGRCNNEDIIDLVYD